MATCRSLGSLVVTAGAGALVTVAGMWLAKQIKKTFRDPPRMRMFNNNLLLSTRCTWLISELGAEEDFEEAEDHPTPSYPEDYLDLPHKLPGYEHKYEDNVSPMPLMPYGSRQSMQSSLDSLLDTDCDSGYSTVPATVVNNDFTMIEGAALCLYLADMYEQFQPPPQYKAEYYSWVVYSAATFDGIIKTLQHQLVDTSERRRDHAVLESALKGFHAFARALSEALECRDYLCGDDFTAADCVLGFTLWWAHTIEQGWLLQDYPILRHYLERLRTRPAFQRTFGTNDGDWEWSQFFTTYVRAIKPRE